MVNKQKLNEKYSEKIKEQSKQVSDSFLSKIPDICENTLLEFNRTTAQTLSAITGNKIDETKLISRNKNINTPPEPRKSLNEVSLISKEETGRELLATLEKYLSDDLKEKFIINNEILSNEENANNLYRDLDKLLENEWNKYSHKLDELSEKKSSVDEERRRYRIWDEINYHLLDEWDNVEKEFRDIEQIEGSIHSFYNFIHHYFLEVINIINNKNHMYLFGNERYNTNKNLIKIFIYIRYELHSDRPFDDVVSSLRKQKIQKLEKDQKENNDVIAVQAKKIVNLEKGNTSPEPQAKIKPLPEFEKNLIKKWTDLTLYVDADKNDKGKFSNWKAVYYLLSPKKKVELTLNELLLLQTIYTNEYKSTVKNRKAKQRLNKKLMCLFNLDKEPITLSNDISFNIKLCSFYDDFRKL